VPDKDPIAATVPISVFRLFSVDLENFTSKTIRTNLIEREFCYISAKISQHRIFPAPKGWPSPTIAMKAPCSPLLPARAGAPNSWR
jgi:hypothetical protein